MPMKIVLIAPYENLARDAEEVCRAYGERVEILLGRMEEGVRLGRRAVAEGAAVLISRGGTCLRLAEQAGVPVVEIAVTAYDVLRALTRAAERGKRIGVAGFTNVIDGLAELRPILRVPVVPIEITGEDEESRRRLEAAVRDEGVDCLVGDTSVVMQGANLGVPCVLIESGKTAIWSAIQEAKRIVAARMAERRVQTTLRTAIDRANQGLLVLDGGTVAFANRTLLAWIGRDTCAGLPARQCLPPSLCDFADAAPEGHRSDVIRVGGQLCFAERHCLGEEGRVMVVLSRVEEIESAERQVRQKRAMGGHVAHYTFDDLYGPSRAMRAVVARAIHFAQTDSSVLIVGETGTGKEVLAQSIHNASPRARGPFVAVNCAALPDQLLESELFGYEDGAFTGARRGGKPGLFELAHGGTIFLDEIGETPLHVQQRLLRVLQERQVMRIGGERVIPVDVRVIAATNQPLWQFVQEGKFRKDLFFRIDVLRLHTVPLRERREDIPELTERLLHQLWYKRKGVGARPRIDPAIYPILQDYHWPGNVRELQNMCDYLVATAGSGRIGMAEILDWLEHKALPDTAPKEAPAAPGTGEVPPVDATLEDVERWAVERMLQHTGGDLTRAAQTLGISRTTLWRKLKQWQADAGSAGHGTNLA
ncbi:sigma 54-interacting transcriptional regulator [Alicyclobacillus macrosporangiidus]|jgi:transcriptional regulator with PAS, ATPase and Fis domain|uniref:Transcriptional regulator containing PAS, AAA-type ATPase, and DNA-binding Fis domains n=1 Tax=Alicyclobacillus macrosporangiidus TaxID=392015 RepID=A0A1I7H038_9BACL|nr:sigma 54-interacting transcriptional regulator [Alicyclobacillus macrosporangiidus]SFU54059.1 Transcriptional regulator containing PAS, AAA-type ATPase, and DNA-binding Fis domains [Alicyclobacillus macrosporangiidus]